MKKKKKQYYAGGKINSIENPSTSIIKSQIAGAKADYKASTDPLVNILKTVGHLGIQAAPMLGGPGAESAQKFLPMTEGVMSMFMAGGTVGQRDVEIEGKEVGETPDGKLFEALGPSHENGGVNVSLPVGTEIYSKRIKIDGVSMAGRKKKREKSEISLEKLLENSSSDVLIKNSLKRTKSNNVTEEKADQKIQEFVGGLLDKTENPKRKKEYMLGGPIEGVGFTPSDNVFSLFAPEGMLGLDQDPTGSTPPLSSISPLLNFTPEPGGVFSDTTTGKRKNTKAGNFLKGLLPGEEKIEEDNIGIKAGDLVSMLGNFYGPKKLKDLTLQNRAEDTPNINAFENFGQDALFTNEESQGLASSIKDNKIQDLELARRGNVTRNRNTASSVNSLRALDVASQNNFNKATRNAHNEYANTILGLLSQRSQLQNSRDQVVMQGEQNRDLADRQDRDNFFSQLAINESDQGRAIQQTGKELNDIAERNAIKNLLDQLSKHGLTFDKNLKLQNPK